MLTIRKVYRRFWWPHPYARERWRLWVKAVIGYRYYVNGIETRFQPCVVDGVSIEIVR